MDVCRPTFQHDQLACDMLDSLLLPEACKGLELPDVPEVALNMYGFPWSTASPGRSPGTNEQASACMATHGTEVPQRLAPATGQGCGQPSSSVAQEQHFHCKVEENTDLWIKQEPASYHKSEPESEPESEPSSASQQAPGSPEPAEWEVDDGPQRRSIRKRRAVAYSAESDSELDWASEDAAKGRTRGRRGRGKVGRPIKFKGDPNAPHLTEDERRRIKRRIANRESARRVRHKKLAALTDVQAQLEEARDREQQISERLIDVDSISRSMHQELQDVRKQLQEALAAKAHLQAELDQLQHQQQDWRHLQMFPKATC